MNAFYHGNYWKLTKNKKAHGQSRELKMGSKKDSLSIAAFLGEGIFTMGYSKKYIMYWGVFTESIIPHPPRKVFTNFTIFRMFFCALFTHFSPSP